MKKFILITSIVFLLLSCDNGTMETNEPAEPPSKPVNPFLGTWEAASGYRDVFTNNTITVYDTENNIYWTATYTYDDTNITVIINTDLSSPEIYESWGETRLLPYRFEDDILFLYYVRLEKVE